MRAMADPLKAVDEPPKASSDVYVRLGMHLCLHYRSNSPCVGVVRPTGCFSPTSTASQPRPQIRAFASSVGTEAVEFGKLQTWMHMHRTHSRVQLLQSLVLAAFEAHGNGFIARRVCTCLRLFLFANNQRTRLILTYPFHSLEDRELLKTVAALSPVEYALPFAHIDAYRRCQREDIDPVDRNTSIARLIPHAPLLEVLVSAEAWPVVKPVLDEMANIVERYFGRAAAIPALDLTRLPSPVFSDGIMLGGTVKRRAPADTIVRLLPLCCAWSSCCECSCLEHL
jgi:hypothetical protein